MPTEITVKMPFNRIDVDRLNAFEEALMRLGEEYGFGITSLNVREQRHPADDLPEIDMTWVQLPRKAR